MGLFHKNTVQCEHSGRVLMIGRYSESTLIVYISLLLSTYDSVQFELELNHNLSKTAQCVPSLT